MKTIQGLVVIDVDVAALNNAGKDPSPINENGVITKKIRKHGKLYPYVSGQAWRYWWRETLKKHCLWQMSPIVRDDKIAYTEANPINYPDDDIFGYMRAGKKETVDDKGKKKKEDITLTRVSVLKNSALISIAGTNTVKLWAGMSRHEGHPVPFSREEYSAMMKGMFSLDLEQAGTFSKNERTGFKNLNESLITLATEKGAYIIDDPFLKDKENNPLPLYRLPFEVRKKRILDTIKVLKFINGGAMQTDNMADVTPKFLILATFLSGNHPFSHVIVEEPIENSYDMRASISIKGLEEILTEYKTQFEGNVFIGKRTGFMDEFNEILGGLAKKFDFVKYDTIGNTIDNYIQQLEKQIPEK